MTIRHLLRGLAALVILTACGCSPCDNTLLAEYPSPDGRAKVTVFGRECGATTGFSVQASILKSESALGAEQGNLFSADTDHGAAPSDETGRPRLRVTWLTNDTVELAHDAKARIFKNERSVMGIVVRYSTIESPRLAALIESLGPDTRPDDLKQLRMNGRDAVRLLIADLQPIPEGKVLSQNKNAHGAAMHVVWVVRALRYLSGKDFRAPTAHVFGSDEDERTREQFLKEADHTVAFFATWMSRDSVYVAPVDAQRKIIEGWSKWFAELDERWMPVAEPSINDWYF